MTKLRNKLVLVLLALFVVACLGVTIACKDDNPPEAGPVTYTVTVTAGDAAAEGVQVTVKKGSAILGSAKATDKDGKVEFSLAEDDGYTVALANLPDGYELPAGATLTFDSERKLTIALAEKFAYKITLVNPDGTPYSEPDVTVGICTLEGNCLNPVAVDDDGVARIYDVPKTDYHVQVLGLPEGYAYEGYTGDLLSPGYAIYKNTDGNYVAEGANSTYVSLSETKTETNVTIYPNEQIKLANESPLTAEQITATGFSVEGEKAYKFEATIAAGATVYYSFTPEFDGAYHFYATEAASYKLNDTFLLGDSYLTGGGVFTKTGHYLLAQAGETYYLNITNTGTAQVKAEFVISTPAASQVELENAGTVKAVINKAGANAVVVLAPTKGAAYELTLKGTGAIQQVTYESDAETATFADADYKENSSCKVRIPADAKGNVGKKLYFAVSVKAESYPATIDVEVKKLADLENEVTDVTDAAIADFGNQTGKELVEIELDGKSSAKLVYNETDKYYHYGKADGPVVVVILTKALPEERFASESPIIYMEMSTNGRTAPYVFDVTPEADKNSFEKGNKYLDYRNLLRGFKDYKVDTVTFKYSIPTDITVDKYYAKAVKNDDGAYPLTKELEAFLKAFVQDENILWYLPWDADENDLWLFACYYYDNYVEPDVIVGEYSHVAVKATEDEFLTEENGKLNGDEYSLVINKRGTYVIKDVDGFDVCETGTWTKSEDGKYSFKTADGNTEYNVTFDAEEGYVTLMTNASTGWAFKNENSELAELVVGEYKFESYVDAEGNEVKVGGNVTADSYKLTVNADGSFVVYEQSGDDYNEVYNEQGVWSKNKDVYTFTVPNGVYVNDEYANLVFAVAYDIGAGRITLTGSDTSKWVFKKEGEAFVGLYELVSFTEYNNTYEVGDEYGEEDEAVEITKASYTFTVVGNTFELNDNMNYLNEFKGVWTKTNGGKYTLAYEDWFGTMNATARYNKLNSQVTVVFGDAQSGYTTYVFQKKANQTIDAIVGEYYIEKMLDFGEEKTVENGDLRSDDYKLEVRASGRFSILGFGYPNYEVPENDDSAYGIWTKTESGYEFSYLAGWYAKEEVPYTVIVSEDLSKISLTDEDWGIGWWFSKSTSESAGEADVIVGDYKFVFTVNGDGEVSKSGDSYRNMQTGETVTITGDSYTLVVLKSGRFAIVSDGEEQPELGLWSKKDGNYTFYAPNLQDAGTWAQGVTFDVEFDNAAGRIVLKSANNGAWIFQKTAAESVEVATEKGTHTVTIDGDKCEIDAFGAPMLSIVSESEDARLDVYANGGAKFYYRSNDGDDLAIVAMVADFESEVLDAELVWKKDGIDTVAITMSMEDDEETGEDYAAITVAITYTEGEPATYVFKVTSGGSDEQA